MILVARPVVADDVPMCDLEQGPAAQDGIFLLTMDPGDQLFSAFGHNGVYVRDRGLGTDIVYNYGVFDAEDPNLLVGFLAGTQKYMLGTRTFDSMMNLYASEERTVRMQRLHLNRSQRRTLARRLAHTARPENRTYLYHWFTANCSTKIRDVLDTLLDGALKRQFDTPAEATKRSELLRHMGHNIWAWLGLRYALAYDADRGLTRWETMFLPSRLSEAVAEATVEGPDGRRIPLVEHTCIVREGLHPPAPAEPPARDGWLWLIGLGAAGLLAGLGWLSIRHFVPRLVLGVWVAGYGVLGAVLGVISIWFWTRSELQVFWRNLDLVHANPATVLLVGVGAVVAIGWRAGIRFSVWICSALAAVSVLGFLWDLLLSPQTTLGTAGIFMPALLATTWAVWKLRDAQRIEPEEEPETETAHASDSDADGTVGESRELAVE